MQVSADTNTEMLLHHQYYMRRIYLLSFSDMRIIFEHILQNLYEMDT